MIKTLVVDINPDCISNSYLAACLERFMRRNGMKRVNGLEDAETVFFMGCNAQERNLSTLEMFRKIALKYPEKRIIALGCTPGVNLKTFKEPNFHILPYWKLVRNPGLLGKLQGASRNFEFTAADGALDKKKFYSLKTRFKNHADIFFIRISDGCMENCTFCSIKCGKGSLRSLGTGEILAEFRRGLKKGKKRFAFFGEDAGCWGMDRGSDISVLVKAMTHDCPRARLLMPAFNPAYLGRFFQKLAPYWKYVEHVSFPIQSGNRRVLKLMNRSYDTKQVLKLVSKIKKISPGTEIVTDVIIGFPTETMSEFMESVKAASHFDAAYFFTFTSHPSTKAAEIKGHTSRREMEKRISIVKRLKSKYNFCDAYLK